LKCSQTVLFIVRRGLDPNGAEDGDFVIERCREYFRDDSTLLHLADLGVAEADDVLEVTVWLARLSAYLGGGQPYQRESLMGGVCQNSADANAECWQKLQALTGVRLGTRRRWHHVQFRIQCAIVPMAIPSR